MLTRSGKHICACCGDELKNYEYYNYECSKCCENEDSIRKWFLALLRRYPQTTDYTGNKVIPENEYSSIEIKVWEISPHPGYVGDYDSYIERSWQKMLEYIKDNFAYFLEHYDEYDLEQGINLNIKLTSMTLLEYLEILENNQT